MRHDSAQMRQCSLFGMGGALVTAEMTRLAQVSSIRLIKSSFVPVFRDATAPVAMQTSAQSPLADPKLGGNLCLGQPTCRKLTDLGPWHMYAFGNHDAYCLWEAPDKIANGRQAAAINAFLSKS
jgi:hypothetical protein